MAKGRKTGGRQKGTPNKRTALLKDSILEAAEKAGDKEGIVGYLLIQAKENPGPFMALLGKILPTQVTVELTKFEEMDDEQLTSYIAGIQSALIDSEGSSGGFERTETATRH